MLLLRGATRSSSSSRRKLDVSIHAPLARSNVVPAFCFVSRRVSIHAPLARSNFNEVRDVTAGYYVSIHAPLARSNAARKNSIPSLLRFNTCSSCEEQQLVADIQEWEFVVSIHAPLARSNRNTPLKNVRFVFQYMLLLRGATSFFSQCSVIF